MKKFPRLTLKEIQKRHALNPQDKKWHTMIEQGSIEQKEFDELLVKAAKQQPLDKKK